MKNIMFQPVLSHLHQRLHAALPLRTIAPQDNVSQDVLTPEQIGLSCSPQDHLPISPEALMRAYRLHDQYQKEHKWPHWADLPLQSILDLPVITAQHIRRLSVVWFADGLAEPGMPARLAPSLAPRISAEGDIILTSSDDDLHVRIQRRGAVHYELRTKSARRAAHSAEAEAEEQAMLNMIALDAELQREHTEWMQLGRPVLSFQLTEDAAVLPQPWTARQLQYTRLNDLLAARAALVKTLWSHDHPALQAFDDAHRELRAALSQQEDVRVLALSQQIQAAMGELSTYRSGHDQLEDLLGTFENLVHDLPHQRAQEQQRNGIQGEGWISLQMQLQAQHPHP